MTGGLNNELYICHQNNITDIKSADKDAFLFKIFGKGTELTIDRQVSITKDSSSVSHHIVVKSKSESNLKH